jgi:hypothetical protein
LSGHSDNSMPCGCCMVPDSKVPQLPTLAVQLLAHFPIFSD